MHVRLSTVLLVGMLTLAVVASAAELPKKYGIELRGGYGMAAMEDVNNMTDTLWGNGRTTGTKPDGSPSFGLSLLYRTHQNFQWEFGYNSLGMSRFESENSVTKKMSTMDVKGSEFYIMPTFRWDITEAISWGIGAGPNFCFASATRSGDMSDLNFPEANGRTIGGMAKIFAEIGLGESNGIHLSAGYRDHYVDRVRWEDADGNKTVVTISPSNTLNLPIDYSGAFFQVGWRFYYQPKPWKAE
ncbi:MAG: hypothetical protein OEM52_12035 [bacterium]|nr:hypothetical protein [bacterium]